MEQKDLKLYHLLETIDRGIDQNQRQMAINLRMSLGMVNRLIQNLMSQGCIRSENLQKRKTKYSLTKSGKQEKLRLKKLQLVHNIQCYNEMKNLIKKSLPRTEGATYNSLLVYGSGELCEIACMLLAQSNLRKIMIIDDEKQGKTINGYSIHNEKDIKEMTYDGIVIMDIEKTNEIRNRLIDNGIPLSKIYTLIP